MPSQRSLHRHRNHFLFSDYYLDNRVMEQAEWREADVSGPFQAITGLWRGYRPHHDNEPQTETDWIQPVLKALGHTFNVQVALKTPFGTRKPDYFLYPTEAARQAAKAKSGPFDGRDLAGALAVADAKAWERSLDTAARPKNLAHKLNISENPSLQIYVYVQYSGLAWGLLTNGRHWRLVHRDSAEALDVYYEVDLPALLDQGDPEAFKYFYLFFRRQAFEDRPDAPAWLGRVLAQSRAYARGVGDTLKEQVYEAQRCLAQGFLDFPANRLQPTPETLKAISDHSLIVLYRLLFVFYAESRGLLPVPDNPAYSQSYSLDALKKRLARDLDSGRVAAASMATVWQQLDGLWQVIDSGNPDLDVPAYNGGLFKRRPDGFLERYRVGDSDLRRAIDLLARAVDPDSKQRVFVDYRDLEIRHLGSIYEGLLEYRVQVADQPLAVRAEKGREVYVPVAAGGQADVLPGQVYLATDKGERKATGSYYTPDFVVKYIVEQTIGPALVALQAQYSTAGGDITDPAALAGAILSLNTLDPSMGSGHFLVEATDYMARSIVALDLPRPEGEAGESDLAYWRRRVAQNCIYGVDLNPLAVELAKLSLWLRTVARGKPLSFLDHHLRCGNSLVGARVADLGLDGPAGRGKGRQRRQREAQARAAGQLSMLDDSAFAGSMRAAGGFMSQIEGLRSDTLAEVRQAEQLYRQVVEDVTATARQLADAWTARSFGLELDPAVWTGLAQHLLHGGFELPQYRRLLDRAGQLAAGHRFFHWELEFPEVFFDPSGGLIPGGGFDAIIGNPPYVRQEELGPLKPYFAAEYAGVYHGVADLFVYFFGRGLDLLRRGGRLAYISSNSWLRANYATPLRAYLRAQTTLETLVDLGDNRVFADAPDLYPAIHIVRREEPPPDHTARVAVFSRGEGLAQFEQQVAAKLAPVTIHDQADSGWQLDDAGRGVFAKLMQAGRPLGEVVAGQLYRGVLTGLNEAFIIDRATRDQLVQADPKSAEVIKPIINGADVRSWYVEDEGRWLIFTRRGIDIDAYPIVKDHLQQYRESLEPCPENWDQKQKWMGRKAGVYKWYEIQDTIDYYLEFEKPKIFWPEMAKQPRFALAEPGIIGNKTTFMIPGEHPYLLGILMTRVTWFNISCLCVPIGERKGLLRYTLSGQFMSQLPIPDAPTADREAIGGLALTITDQARRRYHLHRQARQRILADLGGPGRSLNQKLTAWWDLTFPDFRAEIKKALKRDIPLKERDEWQGWLDDGRQQHQALTGQIVRLETELNERVYALFRLTPAEIKIIEDSTRYRYGEV